MKGALILLAFLAAAAFAINIDPHREAFEAFKAKFSRSYLSKSEEEQRFQIFKSNLALAEARNKKDKHARHGVTKFMDISPAEFKSTYLMTNVDYTRLPTPEGRTLNVSKAALPSSYDWRNHTPKVVTAVKDQGQCGSCWDFSATETLESVWALSGQKLTILSEQQVVDCDTTDSGCEGGWPYDAYQYIISAGGQETEADYPYTAQDGTCSADPSKFVAKIQNWKYVISNQDETTMQSYVYSKSPVSVCVDAEIWQTYTSGVITPDSDCGNSIDHCVQVTGFQNMQGVNAWNVRNSWGTDWGDNGFIYVQIGGDVCSIAEVVTVPCVNTC